jgi:small subunit ribosomal protein S1
MDKDIPIFAVGDEVEAKIIKFDAKTKKVEASVKKLEIDAERELVKKYANRDVAPTLGDILIAEQQEQQDGDQKDEPSNKE